jgi:formylglycine-generating enzyme required for sulfatase activity
MSLPSLSQRKADGLKKCDVAVTSFVLLLALYGHARADSFGIGDNSFDIDFVTIGTPGNAASTFGMPRNAGAVDYTYRIGKYEISRDMVEKANAEGGLKISLHNMNHVRGGARPDMPAAGVSWNEAARFVNWLNDSAGSSHAYKFAAQPGEEGYRPSRSILLWEEGDPGYDPNNPFRNSQAKYFLPSVDEWFKAAFYDPNKDDGAGGYWKYPTGSDTAPERVTSGTDPETAVYRFAKSQGPADITQAGGLSPYGVMAMGGNIFEWMETNSRRTTSSSQSTRQTRGNNWFFAGANELSASCCRHDTSATSVGANGVLGLRVAGMSLDDVLVLLAGDADQDLDFDQFDLIQVQQSAKYLSGQAATWGEGDWDGAPGGTPGDPPAGDGLFNQFDVIAAQQAATYLAGPYAAIQPNGQDGDGQTSVVYFPATGELAVDAPDGVQLTSINIDSASGIFTGHSAANLGGSFDNDSDTNIFKATFGSSFGTLSFGNAAQAGLSKELLLSDLAVVGSLAGGGELGDVDLVYVPEPSTVWLLVLAIGTHVVFRHQR